VGCSSPAGEACGKVIPARTCPTGKALGENVGEGLILKVRGPCQPDDKESSVQVLMRGLGVQDGGVAAEFKTVQGSDRAGTYLYTQVAGRSWLGYYLNPAEGTARLLKSVDGQISMLGLREDLDQVADLSDWIRVALRSSGSEVWLLVNDEPFLYSDDATRGAGRLWRGANPLGHAFRWPGSGRRAAQPNRHCTGRRRSRADARLPGTLTRDRTAARPRHTVNRPCNSDIETGRRSSTRNRVPWSPRHIVGMLA